MQLVPGFLSSVGSAWSTSGLTVTFPVVVSGAGLGGGLPLVSCQPGQLQSGSQTLVHQNHLGGLLKPDCRALPPKVIIKKSWDVA